MAWSLELPPGRKWTPPEGPHRGRLVNLHVVHELLAGLDFAKATDFHPGSVAKQWWNTGWTERHGLPTEQLQVNWYTLPHRRAWELKDATEKARVSKEGGNQSHRDQELINWFSEDNVSLNPALLVFGDWSLFYLFPIALVTLTWSLYSFLICLP